MFLLFRNWFCLIKLFENKQKKAANKQNLENIMYTKEEIKKYTEEHGENVSKFYTFSQSGKEYFQKNLTKGMKKL